MNTAGKLLIPVVLMTAGCVSVTKYPVEWPRAETVVAQRCPDISGEYSEASEPVQLSVPFGSQDPPVPVSLRSVLFERKISRIRDRPGEPGAGVFRLAIGQGAKKLDVSYTEYARTLSTGQKRELPQQRFQVDYSCTSDGVHIAPQEPGKFSHGHVFIAGLHAWEKREITLNKLDDGSLAASYREIGTGVLLLGFILPVPLYASNNDWLRWKKVERN